MKMFLLIFLLVAIFRTGAEELPLGVPPGKFGMSADGLAKIGPVVEVMINEKKLAGANVLILRRGHIVYLESFGQRDREGDGANDAL